MNASMQWYFLFWTLHKFNMILKVLILIKTISCDENEIPYSFLPESEAILVGDVLSSYGLSEDMSLIKSDVNMWTLINTG